MKILITSGGTREPIDDVRYVGNASTGQTGALIAEEAVRRYHTVYLLSGQGSAQPALWALETGLIVSLEFGSAADLLAKAENLLAEMRVAGVVAAAAVADYSPERQAGKLPSSLPELTLRLKPTPKVVDRMRVLAQEAVLVAFKLEADVLREELFSRALVTLERTGADCIVANLASGMGGAGHGAWLLDREGNAMELPDRQILAETVVTRIEEGRRP